MFSSNGSIFINGSGILATDYELVKPSNNSQVAGLNSFGFVSAQQNSVDLNINYTLNIEHDFNLNYINSIRSGISGFLINCNGVSGVFYLSDFGFSIQGADSIQASAKYVNYEGLSGITSEHNANFVSPKNYISNGVVSYLSGTSLRLESLSYNIKFNIGTRYKIGRQFPYEISYLGDQESISLVGFNEISQSFYGTFLDQFATGATIILTNEYSQSGKFYYKLPISGFVLSNSSNLLRVNDVTKYNLEFFRVN